MQNYSFGDVEFHLLKRKSKKGKPIYYVGFLSDLVGKNGRRRYRAVRSTDTGNIALARKVANQMIEKGEVFASKSGIRDYLLTFWNPAESDYIKSKVQEGRSISVAYCANNLRLLETYVLPWLKARGIVQLADLNRKILLSWRVETYETYVTPGKISPRTLNMARQALFVPLRHAVDVGLLPYHPGQGVKSVHETPEKRQIFQLDEYARLWAVDWPDIRYKTACLLSATTGMRMGEVRGLLVKNIHLAKKKSYLDVVTSWQDVEGSKPPKWGSERLGIELPDTVADAIREVLAIHRWGARPDDFVFFNTDDPSIPIGRTGLEKAFKRAMKAAKLPGGRTFHSFRHSLVSHSTGLSAAALKDFIGHTNLETTEGYQHVTNADRAALRKVQAKILPFKKAQ